MPTTDKPSDAGRPAVVDKSVDVDNLADGGELDLPPGVALAWGLRPSAARGPKPGLSLDQIVATAIDLADAAGISNVSMSRVADRLGFTTMSLYRYVAAKDDLVMLMGEAALADLPELDPAAGWQGAADQWARALLDVYRAHPWALDVPITGPPTGPNQLAWLDRLLQALSSTGLSYQEQLSSALLIDGYVRSWSQLARGVRHVDSDRPSVARMRSVDRLLREMVDPIRYPALSPMITAGEFDDDGDDDFDEIFTFSLERIVAGMDALVQARAKKRPARSGKPRSGEH